MSAPRPLVLATLIDAWRHDLCTPDHTPFLCALRAAGGALMEPFGFNTGPAMFAGVYPAVSNQVHKFWYDPQASPFAFTRFIPEFLLSLPRGSGRLNSWIFRRAEAHVRARGATTAKHLSDFSNVPHRLRRYFDLVETHNHFEPRCLPVPTVFDLMRAAGRRFLWIGVPDHALTVASNLTDFDAAFEGDEDLVFVHWGETDRAGHAVGPAGRAYLDKLREVDAALARVVGKLRATGRPVRVLAYGDHGMAPVVGAIDVARELAGLPVSCPRDYVYFLDSTAARFWFLSRPAREAVLALLAGLPNGRLLTDTDLEAYRLPRDRRHWDACWMLEEGWVVRPDFFHAGEAVKGMHGYRPEVAANQAAWMVGGDVTVTARGAGPRPMVDVAATMMALLGLEAPESCEGARLVEVASDVA